MRYTGRYHSPLGGITLGSDGDALTGLWFDGQRYFNSGPSENAVGQDLPIFDETRRWLDCYFSGRVPGPPPLLRPSGSPFRLSVWAILCRIPYGQTTTYGAIARELAQANGLAHMSAQAVGGAVGHNPISLIIPCHRVVGRGGRLTGYAGGIDKKARLLALEGADIQGSSISKTKGAP